MNLVLARIDDRLVHGQVVLGCCLPLDAHRLMLCSDEVAQDPVLERIYRAAVPPQIELVVGGRSQIRERMLQLDAAGDRVATVLVAAAPRDMLWLLEHGIPLRQVNLGGLHTQSGARELWPGLHVTEAQSADLRAMQRGGVTLRVQTVPGASAHDVSPGELEPIPGEP